MIFSYSLFFLIYIKSFTMQKRYCIKISRFLHRLEIAVVTQGERLTYRGQVLSAHKLRRGKRV